MKVVVSVNLGSSRRNRRAEAQLLGEQVIMERIGVDGDRAKARERFLQRDGRVDVFGLGGTPLGVTVNRRHYTFPTIGKIVEGLQTPVMDGANLRMALERNLVDRLTPLLTIERRPRRVLICSAISSYELARSFAERGDEMTFGDLGFGLGIPRAVHKLSRIDYLARVLVPIMGRRSVARLFPAGAYASAAAQARLLEWVAWADLIAGSIHQVRAILPDGPDDKSAPAGISPKKMPVEKILANKVIVTDGTTAADAELLGRYGAAYLVTTTPRIDGQSYAVDVMEAALSAVAGGGRALSIDELTTLVAGPEFAPTVTPLA